MPEPLDLEEAFATDIAVWARVHADQDWTADKPAVRNLAQRLVRVVDNALTQRALADEVEAHRPRSLRPD